MLEVCGGVAMARAEGVAGPTIRIHIMLCMFDRML